MSDTTWDESSILDLLTRFSFDQTSFNKARKQFPRLLCQDTKDTRVHPEFHHLVLRRSDSRQFNDTELCFLLGPNWAEIKERHLAAAAKDVVYIGRWNTNCDLSNIEASKWMSPKFNILGHHRQAFVIDESDNSYTEIPPSVNLAIALTLTACRSSAARGAFCWQPKIVGRGAATRMWLIVPDILYLDYEWTPESIQAFSNDGYRQQRDMLCATLRLEKNDVVLPFVMDFDGCVKEDDEDGRISAYLDGSAFPKAAISIPGAAYIGWYSEMTPPKPISFETRAEYFRAAYKENGAQWLLSPEQKNNTRCENLAAMCEKAREMFDRPQDAARVFYKDVMDLVDDAEDAQLVRGAVPGSRGIWRMDTEEELESEFGQDVDRQLHVHDTGAGEKVQGGASQASGAFGLAKYACVRCVKRKQKCGRQLPVCHSCRDKRVACEYRTEKDE